MLAVSTPCPGVRTVRLGRPDGGPLPGYTPGSHLLIRVGGRANAYSLTGSGLDDDHYEVSVRLASDGNGGSSWMHRLVAGDPIEASGPHCLFPPVASARHHLLVAGGIGVTPLLSHARAHLFWGRPFTFVYRYRDGHAPHLPELRALGDVREHTTREAFTPDLASALRDQPLGTHLYVCGPAGMTDAVLAEAAAAGWPDDRIHTEQFTPRVLDDGRPFTVGLRSGTRVDVPSGVSLLEALHAARITVDHLCRQGVCGRCRLGVLDGRPDHRDLYLDDAERRTAVMPCVSRALDGHLELDL